MSTTSSEERGGEKRQHEEDPEVGPSTHWTVKRPRTGSATAADIASLIGSAATSQRHERASGAAQATDSAFC